MPSARNWIKHPFISVLHAGVVHPQAHWHGSAVYHCGGNWKGKEKIEKSADECADMGDRDGARFSPLPSGGEGPPSVPLLLLAVVLW